MTFTKRSREELENSVQKLFDNYTDTIRNMYADADYFKKALLSQASLKGGSTDYSPTNKALIIRARPEARYVQSFNGWKKAGYSVRKGTKGIQIIKPCPLEVVLPSGEKKAYKSLTKEEKKEIGKTIQISRMAYSYTTVFDIQDTTADAEDIARLCNHAYPIQWSDAKLDEFEQRLGFAGSGATTEERTYSALLNYTASELQFYSNQHYFPMLKEAVAFLLMVDTGLPVQAIQFDAIAKKTYTSDDVDDLKDLTKQILAVGKRLSLDVRDKLTA